jgi:hypothetical protein
MTGRRWMYDSHIYKRKSYRPIDKLPYDLLLRVLDYVKTLILTGVEGNSLLKCEGAIPPDDLRSMSKAIEENCEKVDTSKW